jgi:predicted transcriptional regulator
MTKLLEQAIAEARKLTEAEQDELAAMLLACLSLSPSQLPFDTDTKAAIEEGRAQARRGQFVSDEDMDAFFQRHRV